MLEALRSGLHGPRPDEQHRVARLAAETGFRLQHEDTLTEREDLTPAEAVDHVESRLWSFLWDLDEATWRESVLPALDALRALPDQTRRRRSDEPRIVYGWLRP